MNKLITQAVKLYNSKRYKKALDELTSLKKDIDQDSTDYNELAYYLGLTLTQLERYEEALIFLEQVITSHSSLLHIFQSRMILGYIYTITGRYKLAEFEFNKLLTEGIESIQIYASLGYIYYSNGKINESVEYLKKAVDINKDYCNAINSLGYIYADNNINLLEGINLCKRAVKLKPNNPAYLDSLGWAYYKNGQIEEARSYLRKALDLSPGNKDIVKHMKIVLKKA